MYAVRACVVLYTHTHTPTYYTQVDDLFRFRRPQNVLFIQTPESLNKNNISLVRYVYYLYTYLISHIVVRYRYTLNAGHPSSQR